jgi:hypothetical protein
MKRFLLLILFKRPGMYPVAVFVFSCFTSLRLVPPSTFYDTVQQGVAAGLSHGLLGGALP